MSDEGYENAVKKGALPPPLVLKEENESGTLLTPKRSAQPIAAGLMVVVAAIAAVGWWIDNAGTVWQQLISIVTHGGDSFWLPVSGAILSIAHATWCGLVVGNLPKELKKIRGLTAGMCVLFCGLWIVFYAGAWGTFDTMKSLDGYAQVAFMFASMPLIGVAVLFLFGCYLVLSEAF